MAFHTSSAGKCPEKAGNCFAESGASALVTENIDAFDMWCYRGALKVSYVEHVWNVEILDRIGQVRLRLNRIKLRKLRYFGHTTRHPSLEKDLMLGMMPRTRRQGGQRRQWLDDVKEWNCQIWSTWQRTGKGSEISFNFASDSALADHCERLQIICTYLLHGTVKALHGVWHLQTCGDAEQL